MALRDARVSYRAFVKATAKRAGINPATSAHWLRHAHASHAIDGRADHARIADARTRRPKDDQRRLAKEITSALRWRRATRVA